MKKIAFCALALSLLFLSCSKKENSITEMTNPDSKPQRTVTGAATSHNGSGVFNLKPKGPNSTMTMTGPSAGWCNGYPWNCTVLDEVVIVSSAKYILDYNSDYDSPTKTVTAFTDENEGITDILNGMPEAYENDLLSGNFYMAKGNDNTLDGKAVYLFGDTYPVTIESMKFAISFDYETE